MVKKSRGGSFTKMYGMEVSLQGVTIYFIEVARDPTGRIPFVNTGLEQSDVLACVE